jgi:hypothetical protein
MSSAIESVPAGGFSGSIATCSVAGSSGLICRPRTFTRFLRDARASPWRRWRPHLGLGIVHGRARRWNEAIQEYELVARLGGGLSATLCEMYMEARRLGDAGRRRVEAEFSLEVIGPRLRQFLFADLACDDRSERAVQLP